MSSMDWREIGIIPLTDAAGITKNFNAQNHRGLDIGWYANKFCPVLAWQDGTLIAKGYSGQVGYWLVMEHEYDDGKRWASVEKRTRKCYISCILSLCSESLALSQRPWLYGIAVTTRDKLGDK